MQWSAYLFRIANYGSIGFCPFDDDQHCDPATCPILFKASLPTQLPFFLLSLTIYIVVSLSIGSILGLTLKNQAKLTMLAQLVFLPSIMLSGIMFPISLLPDFLQVIGHVFPAYWGYRLMLDKGLRLANLWYLILLTCISVITCILLMNKQKSE
ncbi:PltK [Streptococcus infantis SK1302]|uniref:PltK n=1 Tax=Streptococcus infantis SK1302 TaxID=871237 RepID=A0ABN0B6I9_9STRE|nr:PltK [Streptococcus infantis SK1302]